MKNLTEKQLTTKEYYRNSFLSVTEDEVQLPNQLEAKRVVVNHPGGVNLIVLDEERRLILVEQYRYPVGRLTLETPAGKIEKGELTSVTAKRELEEETGYTCDSLKMIGRFATSPGFCNEYIENYLVMNPKKLEHPVQGDEDEFLNVYHLSKEEALAAVEEGRICDFKAVYAIQYLMLTQRW